MGWEGAVEMWGYIMKQEGPGCEIGGPALFSSRFVLGRWMPSDGDKVGCGSSCLRCEMGVLFFEMLAF